MIIGGFTLYVICYPNQRFGQMIMRFAPEPLRREYTHPEQVFYGVQETDRKVNRSGALAPLLFGWNKAENEWIQSLTGDRHNLIIMDRKNHYILWIVRKNI